MNIKIVFIFFLLSIIVVSCGKSDRQKKLESREKQLVQQEQQLFALEQQLKLQMQDLAIRERQLDSLKNENDSIGVQNLQLVGNWQVSMQCTEATCEGYAVGDTKTEQWNITYANDKVLVKAMSNKKLIRVYSGIFSNNSLKLSAVPQPDPATNINVVLNPSATNENLMEGQRVIDRDTNCKVVFALKLQKL